MATTTPQRQIPGNLRKHLPFLRQVLAHQPAVVVPHRYADLLPITCYPMPALPGKPFRIPEFSGAVKPRYFHLELSGDAPGLPRNVLLDMNSVWLFTRERVRAAAPAEELRAVLDTLQKVYCDICAFCRPASRSVYTEYVVQYYCLPLVREQGDGPAFEEALHIFALAQTNYGSWADDEPGDGEGAGSGAVSIEHCRKMLLRKRRCRRGIPNWCDLPLALPGGQGEGQQPSEAPGVEDHRGGPSA